MTNEKKIEQLIEHINQLMQATKDISDREIFPVSFFSQAYDITNSIQDDLHQIEIDQIALFENQMKEHQAQTLSIAHQAERKVTNKNSDELLAKTQLKEVEISDTIFTQKKHDSQKEKNILSINNSKTCDLKQNNYINNTKSELNSISDQKPFSDLKKLITINDQFRFCRELFNNDKNLMQQVINEINSHDSFDISFDYLKNQFHWNLDNDIVSDFMLILKRRYKY